MKTAKIIFSTLLAGLFATACKESLPEHFEAIEGIYLNNRLANNTHVDSTACTFIYEDRDILEVPVRVQLVGRTADYPRPVNIRIVSDDAVEGTDYDAPSEAVMPAGAVSFDYLVTLRRTAPLKEQARNLRVEIGANDHFIIPFTSMEQSGGEVTSVVCYKINFSDQFTAPPAGWRSTFIGEFSQQKFELICEVMAMPRADFNEPGKISDAKWMFISSRMVSYVTDQKELKAAGQPFDERAFDEKGEPLEFY